MKNCLRRLEEYYLFFMLCSVIGWLYEEFLQIVVYRWGYADRGVLHGPYCIVYGVGMVLLLLCLRRIMDGDWKLLKKLLVVFLLVILITTGVELIASYIMEWLTGSWMWNYERFAFDFQGRIALNPSIRFGLGGTFLLFCVYPPFRNIEKLSDRTVHCIALPIAGLFALDCILFALGI